MVHLKSANARLSELSEAQFIQTKPRILHTHLGMALASRLGRYVGECDVALGTSAADTLDSTHSVGGRNLNIANRSYCVLVAVGSAAQIYVPNAGTC